MIVTSIKRARGRRNRVRISFDDGAPLEVSDETLQRFGFQKGDELEESRVEAVREAETTVEARTRAINFISYRPRSSGEVRTHLLRKGFTPEVADAAVERLAGLRMIDDAEFARMFVRDRLRRGRSGDLLIRQELIARGINRTLADRTLHDCIDAQALESAASALIRKRMRSKSASGRTRRPTDLERQRLFQYLLRRGFSPDVVRRALRTGED